jgi:hypothetical protein
VAGKIKSIKNPSDPTGNQTCDLPACIAVSQSTVPSCTPIVYVLYGDKKINIFMSLVSLCQMLLILPCPSLMQLTLAL